MEMVELNISLQGAWIAVSQTYFFMNPLPGRKSRLASDK